MERQIRIRFVNNNDGTIVDTVTDLMWTKDAFAFKKKSWEAAMSGKGSCKVGSYKDWRLPSVAELFTLIDYKNYRPALPKGHPFKNVQINDAYWTSTYCACPNIDPGLEPHA